ncbi:MAG: hypothetical protein R3B70_01745 [Polyangiaceae bacterium]
MQKRRSRWTHVGASLFLIGMGGGMWSCSVLGLDSTAYGRDPDSGGCPDSFPPGGAAAGEECKDAKDCAPVCCECPNDREPFAAAACVDQKCVAAEEACALVLDNQPKACGPLVVSAQEEAQCPDDLANGDDPGDECEDATDCEGTCCTCPDGVTTYEAASCQKNECAEEEDACADALAADPSLCP